MVFTFDNTPRIPLFEDGELNMPRTNLATFDNKFCNGQPIPELEYLYRLHPFNTDYGYSYSSLFNIGIQYMNPLDNIIRYQHLDIPYINTIIEKIALYERGEISLKGTYYYASLEAAVLNQYNNLSSDLGFSIDCNGVISTDSNLDALQRRLWILTRVPVGYLPTGTFFPDPSPVDSPDAVLHIVEQFNEKVVSIPTSSIQISIGQEFIRASTLCGDIMTNYITRRDISPLIHRFLPNN